MAPGSLGEKWSRWTYKGLSLSLYSTLPVQNTDQVAARYLLLAVLSLRGGWEGGRRAASGWTSGKVGPSTEQTEMATSLIASIEGRRGILLRSRFSGCKSVSLKYYFQTNLTTIGGCTGAQDR